MMMMLQVGIGRLCQHNFDCNGSQINVSIIEHNGSIWDTETYRRTTRSTFIEG